MMKTKGDSAESDWLRTNRPGVRVPPGAPHSRTKQSTCGVGTASGAIGFGSFSLRSDQQLTSATNRPRALDLFCKEGGATKGLQRAGFHVTGVDIEAQRRYCGDMFYQADALTFPLDGYDFIWASPPCQAFTKLRHMPTAREHPDLIEPVRARLVASGVPWCIENVEDAPLGESGYLIVLCGTMFGLQTADGRAELRRHRLFETSFSIPLRPACQHGYRSVCSVVGHTPPQIGHMAKRRVITVIGNKPECNIGRHDGTLGGHRRTAICVNGEVSPLAGSMPAARDSITVGGKRAMGGYAGRRAITVTGSTAQTNIDHNRTRETFSVRDAQAAMGINWMGMRGLSQAVPPAYSEFIGRQVLALLECQQLTSATKGAPHG
jgi:DNA (cytosine-5)-methyltransferase 1